MHFNVSQLLRERSGAYRDYQVDEELPPMTDVEARRVEGMVRLRRTDRGVWVSAALDTEVLCTCSRCLSRYFQAVRMSIEEETLPRHHPDSGVSLEALKEAGESFAIDEDQILDLTETISQYASLAVPMKPVCRDDCKGICPTCGADLNEAACRCEAVVRDSRWGELLDMVLSADSNEEK